MSADLLTLIMFGTMIVLLMLGIPVAWTMGGIVVIITAWLWDFGALFTFIATTYGVMMNIVLIAIPLFVLMGVLLERSGIAEDLFQMMYVWAGPVRGGLAMGVVVICAIFAAMSGLAAAAAVTMGLIGLPAMRKRGYIKDLAIGSVAAPSTLGILIPPSVIMILLGLIGRISVGGLFMAGMMPGLMIAALFIIYIGIRGLLQPQSCPAIREKYSLKEKIMTIRSVILPMLVIISVLGSIFAGIATPTEAASLGVVALFIATAIHRRLNWEVVRKTSVETFRITAMNMWIIFPALAFASLYTALGGVDFVSGLLLGHEMPSWAVLGLIMGVVFILGMFIDPFAIIWLVGPLSFPIIAELGFDPTWFAILFVINICIAYITPPFGVVLFFLRAIVPPDISMGDIFHSVWPFVAVMVVGLLLVALFPQTALWLPNAMLRMRG